ncbi:cytochrome P450 [Tamaricihabitans halophyticus]|uniref:Cytochrome P450 n=1 Tax=Tamaricihabitans halophyticus TaxID=1262583 RepID=A0A4R2QW69_9PSEU|nr:cytochrome P450 [Tamaricihabitans halophyticus]
MVSMTLSAEQRDSAVQELNEYLDELANKEIADPSDDLISSLVNRITAGELTRTEAAQLGVLLLVGGHETTANMIVLGTLALFEHPEQLATLRHA